MSETKVCSQCKRELPATADFYFRQSKLKCGLAPACKECMGSKFTDKKPIPKEGYKICCHCKSELPATLEYFRARKGLKYGVREICRTCQDEYNHQHKLANKEHIDKYNAKYKEEHKEQIKAYTASRREIDRQYRIDNAERIKAYKKQYAIKNKEALSTRKKQYYAENREYLLEYQKEHRQNNTEKVRAHDRLRHKQRKNDPEYQARRKRYAESLRNNPEFREKERARHRAYRQTPEGKERARIDCVKRRSLKKAVIATLTLSDWQECLEYFDHKDAYTGLPMKIVSQDHAIPLSQGGSYARSNVVPCEMAINSSKNDNDIFEWYKQQPFFSPTRLRKILKWTGLKPNSTTQQISMF